MKILKIQLGILLTPALMAWRGLVLSIMWGWFIVPLGVPAIGVLWAMGLSVAISMFTPQKPQEHIDWVNVFIMGAISPAVTLGLGYAIHWIM